MDSKSSLRELLRNKDIKFGVMSFSASIVMLLIFILLVLVFIAAMFSGLLVIVIGPLYTHIVQILIIGLITPLFIIFIITFLLKIFVAFSKTNVLNMMKNYFAKYPRESLKKAVFVLIFCILAIGFLVNHTKKTINTMRDIPHVISHEYASMDGIVEIEDESGDNIPRVWVDKVIFYEGFAYKSGIVEGKRYHVEYLPHSKYIVDFTLIE